MPDETPTPDETERVDDRHTRPDGDASDESEGDGPAGTAPQRADTPPESALDEAERLTRLARDAVDDGEAAAYREHRAELLAEHGYTARVREDETRDVLVCHPEEWVEDGVVRTQRVDDVDRGIERPLSGPGDGAAWDVVDDHNRDLVEAVRDAHGDGHAANVAALADFMGNHYARPIDDATRAELEEFLEEYYPRNVWPTPEQRALVERSVHLAFEAADERCPIERPR